MSEKRTKQIVVIGDGLVGKTCLLHTFSDGSFLEDYVATIYEKEEFDITINNEVHSIKLIDTAGQEDYDKLRKWFYKDANCFLLCYDISNHASFSNISDVWLPELKTSGGSSVPLVLAATKTDLRRVPGKALISTLQGEELSRKINAYRFIECSAKDNHNIEHIIHEAVRAAVTGSSKPAELQKTKRCFLCGCC